MAHSKAVLEGVGSIETLRISMVRERTPLSYALASPAQAARAARQLIGEDLDREVFGVLLVDTRNRVTAMHVVSMGSLNGSLVHPREVFKCAIVGSSAAIVAFHNHPSGDPAPSREDIALTKRLVAAGQILGIPVLDHLVLGDGTETRRLSPVQVGGVDDVRDLSAGEDHVLVLRADGTAWAWGLNQFGQLGDGTTERKYSAVPIPGMNHVAALSGGGTHSLVLLDNGTVWAFGRNIFGQIGDVSSGTNHTVPWRVPAVRDAVAIAAASDFSMALTEDGKVWTWGRNIYGQLGDGSGVTQRTEPLPLDDLMFTNSSWLTEDPDEDGLTTAEELEIGSDPRNPDTNGDGLLDGAAVRGGKSATDMDMDDDGLSNLDERAIGTDPFRADTDEDSVNDGEDAFPLDPNRSVAPPPDPNDMTPPTITLIEPTNAVKIP